MKVMVNNAATECYRVERERERESMKIRVRIEFALFALFYVVYCNNSKN